MAKKVIIELMWSVSFILIGFMLGLSVLGIKDELNVIITTPQMSVSVTNDSVDILGRYYYTSDKIIIYPGRSSSQNELLDTIYHEYCHYLIDQDTKQHFCDERACER